jgi:diketogulonate reductase-like aldo/keto reductase
MLPVIGLGTWKTFDAERALYPSRAAVLRTFVDDGGRVIDSSPMYGRSETVVGDLREELQIRDRLFVATKVWTCGEREGVRQMEESFARLRVGRLDLMQVHNLVDAETHLRTLREWKAAGRVRYIGVTHWTVDAHRDLERFLGREEIDFVQFNYSLAVRDAERRLLPMAADHGVATLINRPFENGHIFSQTARTPLPDVAVALGCHTWAQVFLKYVISHPAVTCVIPGTADVMHLEENIVAGQAPIPDAGARAAIARAWDLVAAT